MPEGDILTAIDNDLSKWTVRKDKHVDVCVIQRLVPMMQFCKEMRSLLQGNANATIYNL